jgi:hypothetical protein
MFDCVQQAAHVVILEARHPLDVFLVLLQESGDVVVILVERISKIPVFKDIQVTGDLEWSSSRF